MAEFTIGDDPTIYVFDENRMLVSEARTIKKLCGGMSIREFSVGLANGDPDAMAAMVYLAKTRAGIAVRFKDLDDLDLTDIRPAGGGELIIDKELCPHCGQEMPEDLSTPPGPTPAMTSPVPRKRGPTRKDGAGSTSENSHTTLELTR